MTKKEKKRILLVSNGFFPEISPRSYRATELAKEFFRQGHEVTVFSRYRDFDYTDFLEDFQIQFKMWGKSKFPKIPMLRGKPWAFISNAVSRLMLLLMEYPAIEEMGKVKRILKKEEGYDLIISFAVPYPVHWGTAWARSQKHKIADTWIADCGDPYVGDVLDTFRKPFYFAWLEKWFCRKADFITIPVESARDGYYPEFHDKIRIIPQGFDFDLEERTIEINNRTIPGFAYAGGFLQGVRDPDPLLKFLLELDLPFRFYIFTNQPEMLEKYKGLLKDKLIVSEYIPRKELMRKLSKMDFLINFDNNTTLNVPSKLIDYAITGRPVLNIKKEFKSSEVLDFIKGDYSRRMDLPKREYFHIKHVSGLFLDLFKYEPAQ